MNSPSGFFLQVYRGAVRGNHALELPKIVRTAKQYGFSGIVWHGFPRELLRNWPKTAKYALDLGLPSYASWGLDSAKDNDGTRLTAGEKGNLIGSVLAQSTCSGGLLDAEGQWDSELGPTDDMGEAGALELGLSLRRVAPLGLVGDQPWYAIDSHGELRTEARKLASGNVFAGFPVDEFAKHAVNWCRARQAYIYGADKDPNAYERTFARMEREWARIRPAMEKAGLTRPETVTLQGYAWDAVLSDLVDALVDWRWNRDQPVFVWAHGLPTPPFLRALHCAQTLGELGFAKPGVLPRAAIRAFQTAHGLKADGLAGTLTIARAEQVKSLRTG